MVVGVYYFELYIPGCRSRKEKRSVVNSLKQRIKNKYNVAVSEVGFLDIHQRSAVGISTVCLSQNDAEGVYSSIYNLISQLPEVQVTTTEKDFY